VPDDLMPDHAIQPGS